MGGRWAGFVGGATRLTSKESMSHWALHSKSDSFDRAVDP